MNQTPTQPIWIPETGITDLETDPQKLSASEIPGIKAVWTSQRERLKGTAQLADFTEKLSREWAIETGIVENLYEIERGATQTLIEHGFQAELLRHGSTNKPRDYVLQLIRDQKEALDGVFDFVKSNRTLTTSYIKELHSVLLRHQDRTEGLDSQGRMFDIPLIKGDWKEQPNSPVRDGVTYTYCPPEQVASEMDRLIAMHEAHVAAEVPSEVQAAWLHHRFTQIHPFQDGNGRVVRAIASLVLVKDGLFPLVVFGKDRSEYIKALEDADKDNLKPFIDLIAKSQKDQFRKATRIAEAVLDKGNVEAALGGLLKAADKSAADKSAADKASGTGVFALANIIENDLYARLNAIRPEVKAALQRVSGRTGVFVNRSDRTTDYYYRAQIIDNAKNNISYFANTDEYRSWVALKMEWSRHVHLVFAIHGIGKPFNNSLICAPFLEFRDIDEEEQIRSELVPLAEKGFIFFYTEDKDRLLARFVPWREEVLVAAIRELSRNL